uniref:Uncharacterized protein n=1 Tax=Amphimedon queenslandica TaxID=400682 RepID=A0A1X7UQE5_AMPQE
MVLDGLARKISLLIAIFSIIGWAAFVVGFGLRFHEYGKEGSSISNPVNEDHFPYWCFAVSAPFLYIAYFFHLYFNVTFTHYLTIFFTAVYLIPAGGVLYVNGMELAKSIEDETHQGVGSDNYWIMTEFIGAAIAVLFYWFSMMFWPCFAKKKAKGYYDY